MSVKPTHVPIFLVAFSVAFAQIAEAIYTPLIPHMVKDFHTIAAYGQWSMSIFLLGFAVGMLVWGTVSDKIGRKPAFHTGYTIFMIGTLICMFSEDIGMLLFGRLVQSFGAATGSIVPQTMVRDVCDKAAATKAFSVIVTFVALTPLVGPLLGGYVGEYWGWRATFVAIMVIGGIFWAMAYKMLPETKSKNVKPASLFKVSNILERDPFVLGMTLIVGSLLSILTVFYAEAPFIFLDVFKLSPSDYGWFGTAVAIPFAAGALLVMIGAKKVAPTTTITAGIWIMLGGALLWLFFVLADDIGFSHRVEDLVVLYGFIAITFFGMGIILPIGLGQALRQYKNVVGTAGSLFGFSYFLCPAIATFVVGLFHTTGAVEVLPIFIVVLAGICVAAFYFLVRPKLKAGLPN